MFFLFAFFFFDSCRTNLGENYNLIVFTLDTTRYDYIDYGNGAKALTPNIRRIAEKSTIFKNAYSTIPITLPSHASIFTGFYPHKLNTYNNGDILKYKNTLATILRKNHYYTSAVVSLGVLKRNYGIAEGFNKYVDDFPEGKFYLSAEIVTRRALEVLKKEKKRFFYWFHYSDPHEPYAPPYLKKECKIYFNGELLLNFNLFEGTVFEKKLYFKKGENKIIFKVEKTEYDSFLNKNPIKLTNYFFGENYKVYSQGKILDEKYKRFYLKDGDEIEFVMEKNGYKKIRFTIYPAISDGETKKLLYKKEVEYMDSQIGKILSYLKESGLLKKTIILFVGDHGEGLGEYKNHFGHIHYLREQYIKVPLIIYIPGKSPKIVEKPVSTVDIFPTLLKLLGIKKHLSIDGKDLFSYKRKLILSYTFRPESFFNGISIIEGNLQFIRYEGLKSYVEFIDLKNPAKFYDHYNVVNNKRYKIDFVKMKSIAEALFQKRRKKRILDEKSKKILKSLGYL